VSPRSEAGPGAGLSFLLLGPYGPSGESLRDLTGLRLRLRAGPLRGPRADPSLLGRGSSPGWAAWRPAGTLRPAARRPSAGGDPYTPLLGRPGGRRGLRDDSHSIREQIPTHDIPNPRRLQTQRLQTSTSPPLAIAAARTWAPPLWGPSQHLAPRWCTPLMIHALDSNPSVYSFFPLEVSFLTAGPLFYRRRGWSSVKAIPFGADLRPVLDWKPTPGVGASRPDVLRMGRRTGKKPPGGTDPLMRHHPGPGDLL
jgi:hypothetical protein